MQFNFFFRYATVGASALAAFLFISQPASAQVAVEINGNQVNVQPAPILQDGRVFVPLRGVFEQLGASVVYDNGTITATTGSGAAVELQIGSTQATVNGQTETIDVAPFIVGASTYVPLRFISQALGATVDWDGTNQVVEITTGYGQQAQYAPASPDYATEAPPPIPYYEQPPVPAPNYIWQPGYWAWGAYGYYWVPGTWVAAPQTGYLWTPGYWSFNNGGFGWNAGFWAAAVGFYGGINYGSGYYGHGYVGGQWADDTFRYNTAVTRVDTTNITNVYVDRAVVVENQGPSVSYHGGPHGVQANPSPQELQVVHAPHLPPTAIQVQHVQAAAQDRRLLATVNHNAPPITAVAKPLSPETHPEGFVPVTPADRVKVPARAVPAYHAPVQIAPHTVPQVHTVAPQAVPPVVHSAPPRVVPQVHTVPQYHAAPAVRTPIPAYARPAVRTAPPYHAPVAPAYHAPVQAAPVYHPPAAHVAPAYHPPAPAAHAPPPYHPAAKVVKPAPHPKPSEKQ